MRSTPILLTREVRPIRDQIGTSRSSPALLRLRDSFPSLRSTSQRLEGCSTRLMQRRLTKLDASSGGVAEHLHPQFLLWLARGVWPRDPLLHRGTEGY